MKRKLTDPAVAGAIIAAARDVAPVFALRGWEWAGRGVPDEATLRERLVGLAWLARREARRDGGHFGFAATGRLWALVRWEGKVEHLHLGVDLAEVSGDD